MPQIDRLFDKMLEAEASDLHLSTGCKPAIRVHGAMVTLEDEQTLTGDGLSAMLREITPRQSWTRYEDCSDADFAYPYGDKARFRSNIFVDLRGPGAVFRTIPSEIKTAQELELSAAMTNLCMLPKGLVLVTGPTGSGKSTTLAALINEINERRTDHIITIEDPIEFVHPNKSCLINQREVGVHTEGFKPALRAALREDPDVILIGELRDLETIEIALETAETGHLVFGTLHTTTAYSTVDRIIDQFPTSQQEQIRTMLSTTLRAVIAQTLCKRADGRARVACFEMLTVNSAVAALIREGKTYQLPSVIQTGGKAGMILQADALVKLVKRRQITIDEAMAKATDREAIERLLPDEVKRYKQSFGTKMTFAADLGMPMPSGDEGMMGKPQVQAGGLERRTLGSAGGEADSPAAKALQAAKAKMAMKAAVSASKQGQVDDFEAFRNKLSGGK